MRGSRCNCDVSIGGRPCRAEIDNVKAVAKAKGNHTRIWVSSETVSVSEGVEVCVVMAKPYARPAKPSRLTG